MPIGYIYIVPLTQALVYSIGFSTTYTLSVLNDDLPPIFPYVSDTGAWSLEKCIFSFTMGLGALLMYLSVYIRYRLVQQVLESDKNGIYEERLKHWNKTSQRIAPFSIIGLFVVGCFQVWPYIYVHLIGAGMAFFMGWVNLAIQTYISFKMHPTFGTKYMMIARGILSVITGISLSVTALFGAISFLNFKGDDITQWTQSSGGYVYHLISVAGEWISVMGIVLHIALYSPEFRSIVLYKPKLELIKV